MSRSTGFSAAVFIIASASLGAVAMMLVPALFEEFHAGRLITILVLMASALAFGVVAKRNRELMTE